VGRPLIGGFELGLCAHTRSDDRGPAGIVMYSL
jgi:hypothetical protein